MARSGDGLALSSNLLTTPGDDAAPRILPQRFQHTCRTHSGQRGSCVGIVQFIHQCDHFAEIVAIQRLWRHARKIWFRKKKLQGALLRQV